MRKNDLPLGTKIPKHLAIIPDGNRRWAKHHRLPTFVGHERGFQRLKELREAAQRWGIHTVTIWAFSTENWQRSQEEVKYLMKLYEKIIDDSLQEAQKNEVRIIHLGRKDRLPLPLKKKLAQAEAATRKNKRHVLNIALDYGGWNEIIRAVNKLRAKKLKLEITEKDFEVFLDTFDQPYPYPDLLLRTSGETRVSGFMPWQTAYAEFYFTKKHLPDFKVEDLREAIVDYSRRERRFGK